MLTLKDPTKLALDLDNDCLEQTVKLLTYKNQTAFYEYQKFKKTHWYSKKFGYEAFYKKLDELKSKINVCLIFKENGLNWTYSGLQNLLLTSLPNEKIINEINYPEFGLIPWNKKPDYELRYYQKESIEKLLENKHAAIEIPTGAGKTAIIIELAKRIALPTIVMVPSVSIAWQIYDQFVSCFGKSKVGLFGDGKKDYNKLFVIAIAASLARIKEGSSEWKKINKTKNFIVDEAHLTPARTLSEICMKLCANNPYRFFVSGTQMRNDGKDLELLGITGSIVYRKELKELVDEGFLAKPEFKIIDSVSPSDIIHEDYLEMVGQHYYRNPVLAKEAMDLANKLTNLLGQKVLILIEHIEQFQYLFPHIQGKFGFAHGGVTKDNADSVPLAYRKSDPNKLVDEFNDGNLPLLIGTSCVSIGTDLRPVDTIINLQAGSSEVKIRQAVGRGTRLVPGKTSFNYIDFRVNLPNTPDNVLSKHSAERIEIYRNIYDNIEFMGS